MLNLLNIPRPFWEDRKRREESKCTVQEEKKEEIHAK